MNWRNRVPRQMVWGFVDQAFSSATNLLGSVFAARSLSSDRFGQFAVGFSVYLLLLGVSRALTSEIAVLQASAPTSSEAQSEFEDASGASVVIALTFSTGLFAVGFVFDDGLRNLLFALAACSAGLLLQDLWRFVLVTQGRTRAAAANDGLWLVACAALLLAARPTTSSGAFLLWAGPSLICALFGVLQTGVTPKVNAAARWLRRTSKLGVRYVGEFLLTSANGVTLTLLIGVTFDLSAAAGLRGALVLMGPLNALYLGLAIQAVPMLVRKHDQSGPRESQLMATRMTLGLSALYLVWSVSMLLLPDQVGTGLLGDSWEQASRFLPWLALYYLTTAASAGALFFLRSHAAARQTLRLRITSASLTALGMASGAAIAGPLGATAGLALAGALTAPMWWVVAIRLNPPLST